MLKVAVQTPDTRLAHVGAGPAWPMDASLRGLFHLATGHEKIDQAIWAILSTAPGERVMRPEFGCGIWGLVFHPIDATTLGLIEYEVTQALSRWEPRISLTSVFALASPSSGDTVEISISYEIRSTNSNRNLVFPFYVIPREAS